MNLSLRNVVLSRGLALFWLISAVSAVEAGQSQDSVSGKVDNSATNGPAATKRLTRLSLEELATIKVETVYSASKREQKVSDAPSSISIVTAEDIRQFGYRNLFDVLNSVRGLYGTYDRNYEFLGVRGFNRAGDYGGRTLLLVDGHRINEPIFDSVLFANDGIVNVDLIERVEVVRGPGSALYGNNAFFGVINVITKRGADFQRGEVSADVGGYETYKGRFTVGHQFTNGVGLLLSGDYLASEGMRHYYQAASDDGNPANHGGVADNLDFERAHSFFAKLSYGDFTLEGAYVSRDKGVPTASYSVIFNEPRYFTTDDQAFVDLKFAHEFADDWSVLARAAYHYYGYTALFPYDYVGNNDPADFVENIDVARSRVISAEAQVSKTILGRHVIAAGFEVREALDETYENFDRAPFASYSDIHRSDYTWGAFVNAEVQLYRTNLTLQAGGRYDAFSAYDSAFNPRVALVAHPWDGGTLKLTYGQAYRAPNIYEKYWVSPASKGNPGLTPETIRSYEAIYEQQLDRHFSASVSGFHNQLQDLLAQQLDPNDGLVFLANTDAATAQGVEVELAGRYESGLRGRVSYTYSEVRDSKTHAILSNSPRHLLKLAVVAPLYQDKIFASLEAQYKSAVTSPSGNPVTGYCVVNATLFSQKLFKGGELSVSLYNLFDSRYYHPTGSEVRGEIARQDGRSFRVKASWNF